MIRLDGEGWGAGAGTWRPVRRLDVAGDPFAALERFVAGRRVVALLGYDLGRSVERIESCARNDHGLPDLWAAEVESGAERLESGAEPAAGPLESEMSYATYRATVERALAYIAAGDCYQVNLSHRLRASLRAGGAAALYERLRSAAPAPFSAFVEAGDFQVISNSPELLLRFDAATRTLETRPIKGTRPRGRDAAEDARLRAELAADAKERAEHVMIVDLERNDLGRVCETGSVRIGELHRIVTLPTVHHAETAVRGRVRGGAGLAAILRATFPGGSITGAPKVRAMQIIEELEPVRRGLYTGAIGLFLPDGSFTLSIAIRTAVARAGALTLHVGGGVVADSTPAREWEETWHKARAFARAVGRVCQAPPGRA